MNANNKNCRCTYSIILQKGSRLLGSLLAYLWSGWAAIGSLFLFFAFWEALAQIYGTLILPGPLSTLTQLKELWSNAVLWPVLILTAQRALLGLALALLAGTACGLIAGLSLTAAILARPLVTLLLGMPPIAWLVLAMIWFGMGDATVIFTVFIACFPIVFAASMQGTLTLDNDLLAVVKVFGLSRRTRLTDLYLPHLVSWLFPAWITALGTSWKVVVMAELLSTSDGIGGALAVARAQLDTGSTLAWVVTVLAALLLLEYLCLEPIKRQVEGWRTHGGQSQ